MQLIFLRFLSRFRASYAQLVKTEQSCFDKIDTPRLPLGLIMWSGTLIVMMDKLGHLFYARTLRG